MSSVKIGERRDIDVINGKFNEEKDEILNNASPILKKEKQNVRRRGRCSNVKMVILVREHLTYL